MAARKNTVRDRGDLANQVTKMENTKDQASVNAIRRAFKLVVALEAAGIMTGRKSAVLMLRREAVAIAKKQKAKKAAQKLKAKK